MKKTDYLNDIDFLVNRSASRQGKYRRNLRTYYHTFGFGMTNIDDTSVAGYYTSSPTDIEEDTSSGIQENVIKSCIDTLVSKISSQKVRPYFNTTNGTWADMQVCRQLQLFFDQYFDNQAVPKLVAQIFRDACIFDTGVLYIDSESQKISRVLPWQVYFDNREASYDSLTRIALKLENYPITLLPFNQTKIKDYASGVTYYRYWNLNENKMIEYCPDCDYYKEHTWDRPVLPFLFLHYEDPIKSGTNQSIVDMLWGLQEAIDAILIKIKDASQLASPLKFFVPEGSTVKVNKLSNRVGEIVTYTALPNQTTPPVVTATDPFMDPQWQQLLDKFRQDAYEQCGISQLSASSQKPKGLNSGVALANMEEIESDRFEVQLDNVIKLYKDLAKMCISLFDPQSPILPENQFRRMITWQDVVDCTDQLLLQFSAAESLSKDPETRANQISLLVQMGVIPQSRVAALMEIPDSAQGYSLANNMMNAITAVIENALQGNYDVPDFVDTKMLEQEILNTITSLYPNPNNTDLIAQLRELYEMCVQKEQDSLTSAEMYAVQSLQQEIASDLQNPDGQINTALKQAGAMVTEQTQEQFLSAINTDVNNAVSNNNGE